jgi:hypothetical protein
MAIVFRLCRREGGILADCVAVYSPRTLDEQSPQIPPLLWGDSPYVRRWAPGGTGEVTCLMLNFRIFSGAAGQD